MVPFDGIQVILPPLFDDFAEQAAGMVSSWCAGNGKHRFLCPDIDHHILPAVKLKTVSCLASVSESSMTAGVSVTSCSIRCNFGAAWWCALEVSSPSARLNSSYCVLDVKQYAESASPWLHGSEAPVKAEFR